jgi:hypothetical protein
MKSTREMLKKNRLVEAPRSTIIEQTALEFAAVFYDAARSSGGKSTKGQKQWARDNFTKFIPHAVQHLTAMIGQPNVADHLKQQIHEALLERINDPEMQMLDEMHLQHTSQTEH